MIKRRGWLFEKITASLLLRRMKTMKIGQTEQKRVIVIERGNEYQPRQNDAVEARNAFFYESYKQA